MDNADGGAQGRDVSTVNGTAPGTLTIELHDAAPRKAWVSTFSLLSGMRQQWHFVGLLGDEVRYHSGTFSAPYGLGYLTLGRTMLPRNEWAPGMNEALRGLRAEIAGDGWVADGRGDQAWQDHYRRPGG